MTKVGIELLGQLKIRNLEILLIIRKLEILLMIRNLETLLITVFFPLCRLIKHGRYFDRSQLRNDRFHLFLTEKCCPFKETKQRQRNYHCDVYSHSEILSKENFCISGIKKEADPDFAPPYMLQHRQV